MSLHVEIDVSCDDCDERYDDPWPSGWQVRESAAAAGWQVGLRGGKDRCPDCADARAGRSPAGDPDLY